LIDQWLSFVLTEGYITPYNKVLHISNIEAQIRNLKIFDEHLSAQTFVVGERPTIADFVLAGVLSWAFAVTFDAALRKDFPNVDRFFETEEQPEGWGETEYVEKALQYVPPKKEKPKKEENERAPKPKDDDEEEETHEDPEPKNPLDLLPKSTFNLEDWKLFCRSSMVVTSSVLLVEEVLAFCPLSNASHVLQYESGSFDGFVSLDVGNGADGRNACYGLYFVYVQVDVDDINKNRCCN